MQKSGHILTTIAFAVVIILSLAQQTYAINVYVAKEDGTAASTFEMGEKVRIITYSTKTPFDITVIDPEGKARYKETSYTRNYDKILNGITDKAGRWEVIVTEQTGGTIPKTTSIPPTSTHYTTTINNVVPEVPLGTITILMTFLAAFGIIAFRKKVTLTRTKRKNHITQK